MFLESSHTLSPFLNGVKVDFCRSAMHVLASSCAASASSWFLIWVFILSSTAGYFVFSNESGRVFGDSPKMSLKGVFIRSACHWLLSWSMLSHVLSKEQSKDGSDGASDDGRLTIVQCHHYYQPPLSDLYRSSVGILPLLRYHQHNLHSYHCHYQPAPCAFYCSTTRAPPCSTHIPCSRPITLCMHQFSRS